MHPHKLFAYIIAAPEINGDSSLISRPVRGDLIAQYLGQECRTLETHVTNSSVQCESINHGFYGLVEGLVLGRSFVRFRPSYVGSSRQRRFAV